MDAIDSTDTPPTQPPRRHRSRTERRALVAAWRSSGLNKAAFAQDRGLSPKTLGRWVREESQEDGPGFVPVVPAVPAEEPLRWVLPQGLGTVAAAEGPMTRVLLAVLREVSG